MKARLTVLALLSLLAACSGNYGGGAAGSGNGSNDGVGSQARSMEEFFGQSVQPQMDFCRTCHVPGSIADVENGHDFMLSANRTQDLANLKASWERLGRNNPTSRLLLMSSGQETPHAGGAPWPQGSAAYRNVDIVLKCFADPAGCLARIAGGAGGTGPLLPLLGSSHAGHAWFEFCEGQPDDAPLPADPRTLIQPGVNAGKAVHFNFHWKSCTQADGPAYPVNCGELRQRQAHGATMMRGNGAIGQNTFFAGDHPEGLWQLPAAKYNTLWQGWGLDSRPANFDQLVAERYGLGMGTERNPYPRPGEDPQASNGGSGQLPTAMTQVRGANGEWTGRLGFKCHVCHSDQIDAPGVGVIYGSGNGTSDFDLFLDEVIAQVDRPIPGLVRALPFTFNKVRGSSNALQLQIIALLFPDDLGVAAASDPLTTILLGVQFFGFSPNSGEINPPAWWNLGRKPSKFFNGLLAGDNLRSGSAFDIPIGRPPAMWADIPAAKQWTKDNSMDPEIWYLSLRSPQYPGAIDTAQAEQGAILFHSKDLWAAGSNADIPRPQGNGSCAGCHGAYSPRFVNDPAYLDTPALAGTAGYIVPLETIGTDPHYADAVNDQLAEMISGNIFVAYNDTYGQDPDCTIQTRKALSDRAPGYLAMPLHGVWATAPYFHNGSVPDLWSLLKPADRPVIWSRVSAPAAPEQEGEVVMGFDRNFARAYDPQKLGWRYTAIDCRGGLLNPDCDVDGPTPLQQMENAFAAGSGLSYNFTTAPSMFMSQAQVEKRKIYNTWDYARSNRGHEFTQALSDPERRAIIEYLKTL
ncbi:MAG TPA: hypothetical protein VLI06_11395 [Solimonas sp.]|nr:hypothetical protein [Solimonas sp.]